MTKKLNIILLLLFCVSFSYAQNVAINADGSLPDATAILDIKSITKGVLLPRLKTSQRLALTASAIGLIVYDIETQSFWYKGDVSWFEISNTTSNFWKKFGSSYIYNKDSLPVTISNIGLSALNDAMLNVQKRDPSTTGLVDLISLQRSSTGTATDGIGGGIAFKNAADNATMTLTSRIYSSLTEAAEGTNRSSLGFVTYNGGTEAMSMNMTESGLKVGSLSAATSKLDVAGDINADGEVHRTVTGDANMVPIAYGWVNSFGVREANNSTSNFTSLKVSGGNGKYDVRITGVNLDIDDIVVVATSRSLTPRFISVYYASNSSGEFSVNIWDSSGVKVDDSFHFVVYLK